MNFNQSPLTKRPLSSVSKLRASSSNPNSKFKSNYSDYKNQSTYIPTSTNKQQTISYVKIKVIENETINAFNNNHITPFDCNSKTQVKNNILVNSLTSFKSSGNNNSVKTAIPNRPQTAINAKYVQAQYDQIFSKDKLIRKKVKGKLVNEVNRKILVSAKELNPEMFAPTYIHGTKCYSEKFKAMDERLKVNIFTNKTPELLNFAFRNYKFMDSIVTADELVYKHFSEKEIEMIKSDPNYFKTTSKKFRDVEFFRPKTLIERLEEEEKMEHKKIKKNITESIKKSLHELATMMQTQDNPDENKVEKTKKIDNVRISPSPRYTKGQFFPGVTTPRRRSILPDALKSPEKDEWENYFNNDSGIASPKSPDLKVEKQHVYEHRRKLLSSAFKSK